MLIFKKWTITSGTPFVRCHERSEQIKIDYSPHLKILYDMKILVQNYNDVLKIFWTIGCSTKNIDFLLLVFNILQWRRCYNDSLPNQSIGIIRFSELDHFDQHLNLNHAVALSILINIPTRWEKPIANKKTIGTCGY